MNDWFAQMFPQLMMPYFMQMMQSMSPQMWGQASSQPSYQPQGWGAASGGIANPQQRPSYGAPVQSQRPPSLPSIGPVMTLPQAFSPQLPAMDIGLPPAGNFNQMMSSGGGAPTMAPMFNPGYANPGFGAPAPAPSNFWTPLGPPGSGMEGTGMDIGYNLPSPSVAQSNMQGPSSWLSSGGQSGMAPASSSPFSNPFAGAPGPAPSNFWSPLGPAGSGMEGIYR